VTRLAEFGFPFDLNLAPTDLRTLLYEVLSAFQDQMARRGASCEVSLDPTIDEVVLDRDGCSTTIPSKPTGGRNSGSPSPKAIAEQHGGKRGLQPA
jgi:signal transduction histidine kinase